MEGRVFKLIRYLLVVILLLACSGCAPATPGPDKQFSGILQGAATGAGTGAVTGFQVGAGTGPGALAGAGLGAVAGGIQGAVDDTLEEELLDLARRIKRQQEMARVHEILSEHYQRRLELHPTRDIFPADLFFHGDEYKLKNSAVPLVHELARMNKTRLPWSRLVIAAYARASDPESVFAKKLTERRAQELGDHFIRAGLEARRVSTRAVLIKEPILIDPHDDNNRYNQAVEIIPLDR